MGVKKVNAVLGLILTLACISHIAVQLYAALSHQELGAAAKLPMHICMGAAALHILLSFGMIFFLHEGKSLKTYPKANAGVILQRCSGILMVVLLFFHFRLSKIVLSTGESGMGLFVLCMCVMILFFGTVFLHISVSFTKALVTLGIITERSTKRKIDHILWVVMGIAFLAVSILMTYAYTGLYHTGG